MRRGIFTTIFAPVAMAISLAILAFGAISALTVREYFFSLSYIELTEIARMASRVVLPLVEGKPSDPGALRSAVDGLVGGTDLRVTVMDMQGYVLADSMGEPSIMQNHMDRPEVRKALDTGQGWDSRRSATVNREYAYSAVALKAKDGSVLGVARASLPITIIDRQYGLLSLRLALIGAAVALLAGLFSFALAGSIRASVSRIRDGALAYAQGRLVTSPLAVTGPREIADLAGALNRMAKDLDERLEYIERQKAEAEAVLNGMTEGIVVVGADLDVRSCNPAALRFFKAVKSPSSLIELCHNTEILSFAQAALGRDAVTESTVTLFGENPRIVHMTATPLGTGETILVINDITRLTRLETVRRDFVANVSHELKTPVTVIRSALETLADGAFADPEASARFISSASRQAERLSSIIEDILSLARIEEEEGVGLKLDILPLKPSILAAAEAVRSQADGKSIRIEVDCPDNLLANINPSLIEQALVNLLDNAVKYSDTGTSIRVAVVGGDKEIRVKVIDQGHGIPAKDRPRIFERFYRVDPARSRELGGTGLGLSIVKHIAKAHGGTVSLESEEGRGSTFTLILTYGHRL